MYAVFRVMVLGLGAEAIRNHVTMQAMMRESGSRGSSAVGSDGVEEEEVR